jgi:mitochondrial fission protein ELM1
VDLGDPSLNAPLSVWAVSDGRAGIDNQVLGLAEAVGRLTPVEIVTKRIGWKAPLDPLPPQWNPAPLWGRSSGSSRFDPPWPDLWIAAGRASLPLSIRVRKKSGGRTFVVQLQDPRTPSRLFDLVAPPAHDKLTGSNVFPIVGAPHRITTQTLAAALEAFRERIDPLPRPRVTVLIGGKSKAFDLPPARSQKLADDLAQALDSTGASLLMTFSRRTPETAKAILRQRLSSYPGIVWDGAGENPYFAFLAAADFVVATQDSVNMVAEAASTGKPVYIAAVDGDQWRKKLFHADLAARGVARPFQGVLEPFSYAPLCETERLAAEVLRRLQIRQGSLSGNEAWPRTLD